MMTIETNLKKEIFKLEKIVRETRQRLKKAPKGNLRIRKWKGVIEYYYSEMDLNDIKTNSNIRYKNGRYLRKSEKNLAKDIAQRDYDIRLIKNAEERIKAINIFLNKYERTCLKKLYRDINQYRKELIDVAIISDDEYVKRWQAVEFNKKPFEDDLNEIVTERGERVRSKSEKIIADKLFVLGIPYRYEYPIILEGNIKIYPDFTILKMPERKEVYLEHFGMIDDEDYLDSVLFKLNTYERNGIYLGVNLFITHETKKSPLNMRALDGMIKQLFCMD